MERGRDNARFIVLITPIRVGRKPTWPAAYAIEEIDTIEENTDDFAGEYLCEPSAGADIMFDRSSIDRRASSRCSLSPTAGNERKVDALHTTIKEVHDDQVPEYEHNQDDARDAHKQP